MTFAEEQKEILKLADSLDQIHGRKWYKFKGDVIARKIIQFLSQHVGEGVKIVGPSVFIKDFPTEYDALAVRADAEPFDGTNAYEIDDILITFEIKKHGLFYRKEEGYEKAKKYFRQISVTDKPFLYITIKESKTFIETTRRAIGDCAFFLCVSNGEPIGGEWERFVEKVSEEVS